MVSIYLNLRKNKIYVRNDNFNKSFAYQNCEEILWGSPQEKGKYYTPLYVNKFLHYMLCHGCDEIMQTHKHEKVINMKN